MLESWELDELMSQPNANILAASFARPNCVFALAYTRAQFQVSHHRHSHPPKIYLDYARGGAGGERWVRSVTS